MVKISFADLLVHNIYKQTSTSSQNDIGEWTHTWTTGTSAIECRVNPITGKDDILLTGRYDDVQYKVYMRASESVYRGDQVSYSSEIYEVKDVRIDSSTHNKTAYLKLIT